MTPLGDAKETPPARGWPLWAAIAVLAVASGLAVVAVTAWRVPLDIHFLLPWLACFVLVVVLVILAVVAGRRDWRRITCDNLARLATMVALLMALKIVFDAVRAGR